MTARRQASTTSLSKYARSSSPDPTVRSLDFCNAFWGVGDSGVDVLFARMRGAARTMDELRNYWKERAAIEEDYAKRLAKLAKLTVGRDEIGELRNSLDTLRLETDKEAGFHQQLASQIRNDLEAPAAAFVARQNSHRKGPQAAIEKQFKAKQAHEAHVAKAREKYEADCMRINGLTAQATLVQGKDLEKIQRQLERTQQTVQANEKDYANFSRILQDTAGKWEVDWKTFCDGCQDLEEERMEFTKDNVWAYANAVSIVCVSDDESCERLRLALEQFEPEKDQENFVRDYGTGSAIPEPPVFVNHGSGAALPSPPSRPLTRPAQFSRSSQRMNRPPTAPPQPVDDEPPAVNAAGIGAGGLARAGTLSRGGSKPMNGNGVTNGNISRPGTSHGPDADPTTHKTQLVVGDNAYDVDLNKNPQQQQQQAKSNGAPTRVGDESDPLAQQMANLQRAAAANGSLGRSGTRKDPGASASGSASPNKGPSPSQDNRWRNSAELVVGAYPLQAASSRPTSPTANFMKPPAPAPAAPAVESALVDYHQRLPGEQRGRSRSNSRASWNGQPPPAHQRTPSRNDGHGQNLERPVSREGHAGIGANGRSPSPGLRMGPGSRSVSPAVGAPPAPDRRESYRSTNSVGIALDPSGKVAMDSMADQYMQQQRQQQQQQQAPPQQQLPPPQPYQTHVQQQQQQQQQQLQAPGAQAQRRPSVSGGHPYATAAPVQALPQSSYGMAQPPPPQQQPPPPQQPPQSQLYRQPTQHQQPMYAPPTAPAYSAPPPAHQAYGAPPPHAYAPPQQDYYAQQQQQQQQQQQYQQPPQQQQYGAGYAGYRSVSPQPMHGHMHGRSPSPQPMAIAQPAQPPQQAVVPPTRQYTEDGRGVLFYVKALYDYNATIPEEFDFQAGDIIAVTATPEDGWWSGELLDEARRIPGRHIFPSNFVSLF